MKVSGAVCVCVCEGARTPVGGEPVNSASTILRYFVLLFLLISLIYGPGKSEGKVPYPGLVSRICGEGESNYLWPKK